jgi:hypothetical protein
MTILGEHTAHELSDLLTAKQANVAALSAAAMQAGASVDTTSPAWNAWLARYTSFLNAWNDTAANAQKIVENDESSILGWDYTTEESWYNAVLTASDPISGLSVDFAKIPGNPQANYGATSVTPQPTAPDADLSTLNALNAAPVVGAGGAIDQGVAAATSAVNAAENFLKNPASIFGSPTAWLVGAAVVGTLGAVFLLKRAI